MIEASTRSRQKVDCFKSSMQFRRLKYVVRLYCDALQPIVVIGLCLELACANSRDWRFVVASFVSLDICRLLFFCKIAWLDGGRHSNGN
jgi:hypothetical protein